MHTIFNGEKSNRGTLMPEEIGAISVTHFRLKGILLMQRST